MLKISNAIGNGQSQCKGCAEKGKWNWNWTSFLYKIEGKDGCYCWQCVMEMQEKEQEVQDEKLDH